MTVTFMRNHANTKHHVLCLIFKTGLGFVQTNVQILWKPVYQAFHPALGVPQTPEGEIMLFIGKETKRKINSDLKYSWGYRSRGQLVEKKIETCGHLKKILGNHPYSLPSLSRCCLPHCGALAGWRAPILQASHAKTWMLPVATTSSFTVQSVCPINVSIHWRLCCPSVWCWSTFRSSSLLSSPTIPLLSVPLRLFEHFFFLAGNIFLAGVTLPKYNNVGGGTILKGQWKRDRTTRVSRGTHVVLFQDKMIHDMFQDKIFQDMFLEHFAEDPSLISSNSSWWKRTKWFVAVQTWSWRGKPAAIAREGLRAANNLKTCLAAEFVGSRHYAAVFSLQVPKSGTHLDLTSLYISILRTYAFELLPNRYNWFVSTKTNSMKCFVNWIPANSHVRSNKIQPYLNSRQTNKRSRLTLWQIKYTVTKSSMGLKPIRQSPTTPGQSSHPKLISTTTNYLVCTCSKISLRRHSGNMRCTQEAPQLRIRITDDNSSVTFDFWGGDFGVTRPCHGRFKATPHNFHRFSALKTECMRKPPSVRTFDKKTPPIVGYLFHEKPQKTPRKPWGVCCFRD